MYDTMYDTMGDELQLMRRRYVTEPSTNTLPAPPSDPPVNPIKREHAHSNRTWDAGQLPDKNDCGIWKEKARLAHSRDR